MLESQILREVMEYLTRLPGGVFWRNNNAPIYDKKIGGYRRPNKYTPPGIPDVIGCMDGKFVCIEVKTPQRLNSKDESSIAQRDFINRVIRNGGRGVVVCSVDQVKDFIEELYAKSTEVCKVDWV